MQTMPGSQGAGRLFLHTADDRGRKYLQGETSVTVGGELIKPEIKKMPELIVFLEPFDVVYT